MVAPVLSNATTTKNPPALQTGFRLLNGEQVNNLIWADTVSAADGIVANPGGGQANATPLLAAINRVSVVATSADSVMLPPATGGNQIQLINDGANSMQVFGNINTSDTINGTAGSTGVAQNTTTQQYAAYFSPKAGVWRRIVNSIA